MGGGKKKTYTSVFGSKLFNPSDNLLSKDIVRTKAFQRGLSGVGLGNVLMSNIRNYLNWKKMEVLGFSPTVEGRVESITPQFFSQYFNVGNYAKSINQDGFQNDALYIFDYLNLNNTSTVTGNIVDYTIINSGFTLTISKENNLYEIADSYGVWEGSVTLTTGTNGLVPYYVIAEDGRWSVRITYERTYQSGVDALGEPIITTETVDDYLNIPASEKTMISGVCGNYVEAYSEDLGGEGGSIYHPAVWEPLGVYADWKSNISGENFTMNFLVIPIKTNGAFQDNRKSQIAIQDLGLNFRDTLEEESFKNSDIKNVAFSYASKFNRSDIQDEKTRNAIKDNFKIFTPGVDGKTSGAIIANDLFSIQYKKQISFGPGLSISTVKMIYNGVSASVDLDEPVFLVPIPNFEKLSFEEKYNFIRDCMSIIGNTSKTVKLKWYQTGLFKIVIMIVSMVISYFTGPKAFMAAMKMMAVGFIITTIATMIDPRLGAIVGIAMIAYGGYTNWGDLTALQQVVTIVDVAGRMSQLYFQVALEGISDKIKQLQDKTKETAEVIRDMLGDSIYSPLDVTQDYYDTAFDLLYDYQDQMYEIDAIFEQSLHKGL